METLSVFNYNQPRQFLLDSFNARKRANPAFSVRSWAKEMGVSSHALLVMLLQGKRPLRIKHASFLTKGLSLSAQETLYFQALIQLDSATTPEEKELCCVWLADLNPGKNFRIKEFDEFVSLSHWLYTALLAMTDLKNFTGDEAEVVQLLRGRVAASEVRSALQRLLDMKLLEREKSGRLKCTYKRVTSKNDIIDAGVRKYHRLSSELAIQAVEELPPEKREFQSFSLAVDKKKIPLAKELIRKFRAQFAKAVGSESGNEICQMNIQFFQLTENHAIPDAKDEGVDTESVKTFSLEGERQC